MAIQTITPQQLKRFMDEGKAFLIDVREPSEYKEKNIPGALNVPLGNLDPQALDGLAGKALIVHCQAGTRSRQAAGMLEKSPCVAEIYDLEGGIKNWEACGLPVGKGANCPALPLMRQVQLIIGLFILGGCLLTYFVNPAFLIIPFLMGLGLTNAGLTGWCGLAKLLGFMPWNR